MRAFNGYLTKSAAMRATAPEGIVCQENLRVEIGVLMVGTGLWLIP
jgi:hypothetical protein